MTVIDYPGHQRLKTEMLQSYLRKAGALLFVLDASNLKSDIARTAQQLYDILTQSYVSEAAVPVIVACNKSDDVQAANANQSKQMLLVELYVSGIHCSHPSTLPGNIIANHATSNIYSDSLTGNHGDMLHGLFQMFLQNNTARDFVRLVPPALPSSLKQMTEIQSKSE